MVENMRSQVPSPGQTGARGDCLRLDYTDGRGNAALYYGIPKGLANEL
jgi:hypothetical protein